MCRSSGFNLDPLAHRYLQGQSESGTCRGRHTHTQAPLTHTDRWIRIRRCAPPAAIADRDIALDGIYRQRGVPMNIPEAAVIKTLCAAPGARELHAQA